MSAAQRRKGHNFERAIANAFRKRWPHLADRIRRSQQAHQAFEPDVVIEGVPLWCECTHGRAPDPLAKLEQAERDVDRCTVVMLTFVVWRRDRCRPNATMRLRTLRILLGYSTIDCPVVDRDVVVTLPFDSLLEAMEVERWTPSISAREPSNSSPKGSAADADSPTRTA